MIRAAAILVVSALTLDAATITASSVRGAGLFNTLSCVQCHSVNGKGGTVASDLGRLIDRNFTPASLAATMWNHAPTMWAKMGERNVRPADLNEQAASDLFAYFYAARYFEKPGDAGRGKRLFSSKHCSECHGLTDAKIPEIKPVSEWASMSQPIALVNEMWNHGKTMRREFAFRKFSWPELTAQDLGDILVYLRNLPSSQNAPARVEITSGANGQTLFEEKRCAACHKGKLDLAPLFKNRTLTDIAVEMWNHEPKMNPNPPQLTLDEMSELVSYLWAGQFFRDEGDAGAGERLFASKGCATCHEDAGGGGPRLTGKSFTAAMMVSALWHHGPAMLQQMRTKSIAWPRFEGQQMSNLLAYLNSRK